MKKTVEIEVTKGHFQQIHSSLRELYNSQESGESYSLETALNVARNIRKTKETYQDIHDDILVIKKASAKRDAGGKIVYENGNPVIGDFEKFETEVRKLLQQKVKVTLDTIKYKEVAKISTINPNIIEPLLDILDTQ